jgi:hypothetical protein
VLPGALIFLVNACSMLSEIAAFTLYEFRLQSVQNPETN